MFYANYTTAIVTTNTRTHTHTHTAVPFIICHFCARNTTFATDASCCCCSCNICSYFFISCVDLQLPATVGHTETMQSWQRQLKFCRQLQAQSLMAATKTTRRLRLICRPTLRLTCILYKYLVAVALFFVCAGIATT